MPLSEEQHRLISSSFARLVPITPKVASLFYNRLWELAPETRPMFKTDINEQGMKLMQTLGTAVRGLHDLDSINTFLLELGKRHITYGVKPEQYAIVKEALMWMLQETLKRDFTPAVREAWSTAYDLIAEIAMRAYQSPA